MSKEKHYDIANGFTKSAVKYDSTIDMWRYLNEQYKKANGRHYYIEVNITSYRGLIVLFWCWLNGVSVRYRFGKIVVKHPRDT